MDAMVLPMLIRDKWKVHSKFSHAINLTNGSNLISLTTNDLYLTPGGIRVNVNNFNLMDISIGDNVLVDNHKIIINQSQFSNIPSQVYSSYLKPNKTELQWEDVMIQLEVLRDWLINQPKHTASIDWIVKKVSTQVVEQWMFHKLISFEESVNQSHINIFSILGAGQGLTPTGDDVLCGYLAIFHYLNLTTKMNSVRQQLLDICPQTTTDVSKNMIFYAVNGYFSDVYRDLIKVLFHGGNLTKAAENCASVGHTSGIDFMCGILKALESISNKKGEDYGKTNTYL